MYTNHKRNINWLIPKAVLGSRVNKFLIMYINIHFIYLRNAYQSLFMGLLLHTFGIQKSI